MPVHVLLALLACKPDVGSNVGSIDVAVDATLVNRAVVTAELVHEAASTLTCTEASGDRFVLAASPSTEPTFDLVGLLASTAYDCTLDAGGSVDGTTAFTTGALPVDIPQIEATGTPAWGAYTLFNHVRDGVGQKLVIIDPEGHVRWYRFLEDDPNVGIEASLIGPTTILAGGGNGYNASFLDLDGERTWEGPDAPDGGVYDHDTQLLPTGEVMSLVTTTDKSGNIHWMGFAIQVVDPATNAVDWQFTSQAAADAGELPKAHVQDDDLYHANAITWMDADPQGPAIWTSTKMLNQILRIDAVTGEIGWKLGVGGDFTLLDASGAPLTDPSDWFYGEHGPDYTMLDGDPNRWRFWVHDNGFDRPNGTETTRALALDVDLQAKTATVAWTFTEDGWYEPVFGDVDALPDGSVFIAEAHCPQCHPAPKNRGAKLLDVDPATNDVLWRYVMPPEDSSYRGDRIDGCALWANQRYCPK